MITGKKIKLVRQLKNIPPKEMADKLELDYSTYTRIERGDTRLTETRVEEIISIFNVSRDFIEKIEEYLREMKEGNQGNSGKIAEQNHEDSLQKTLLLVSRQIENQNRLIENFIAYISSK